MSSSTGRIVASAAGGLTAAIVSSLCCLGPLVAVFLGISGAGLARTFEPVRPLFVVGTIAALAYAHWTLRREKRRVCEPGTLCASPRAQAWTKWMVWGGTVLSVPLLLFPWWSRFVLT